MQSDRKPESERDYESCLRENAALKKRVMWLSRQLCGRAMPGLFTFPAEAEDGLPGGSGCSPDDDGLSVGSRTMRESPAPYHAGTSLSVPPGLPSENVTLELPPGKSGGMTAVAYETAEAIAVRPAVVRRVIRRAMYVANDGSGMADAAPAPALFPDPSGGLRLFDASFVACAADFHLAGMPFHAISDRLKMESGLVVSESTLCGLVLAAAEVLAPVCSAMVVRTLPDWTNLRRMFEEAKAGGDWLADEFLQKIHALYELEKHARVRAERLGGAPEDLYRERRAVRAESARIAGSFFERCRETLPSQNPQSPLAEALAFALEHESFLSEYLYDPRMELSRANPETPVADRMAVLAICADECLALGVSFRAWLENTLVKLKQSNPPPPETLFPR